MRKRPGETERRRNGECRRFAGSPVRRFTDESAFTMIEIAIALAVIAFALVAIIGVLPLGMNVQKENRQQTIINQDASFFFETIRNGSRGANDLTNYVIAITNYVQRFDVTASATNAGTRTNNWFTFASASIDGTTREALRLTNGARIIGLLSTPKYVQDGAGFNSNFVVANFRALSGAAVEKFPQKNEDQLNLAFSYRLIPELSPLPTSATDTLLNRTFQTNLHELRLRFRWPILPNGVIGNQGQTYRTLAGGRIVQTNADSVFGPVYFLQPSTFSSAQ